MNRQVDRSTWEDLALSKSSHRLFGDLRHPWVIQVFANSDEMDNFFGTNRRWNLSLIPCGGGCKGSRLQKRLAGLVKPTLPCSQKLLYFIYAQNSVKFFFFFFRLSFSVSGTAAEPPSGCVVVSDCREARLIERFASQMMLKRVFVSYFQREHAWVFRKGFCSLLANMYVQHLCSFGNDMYGNLSTWCLWIRWTWKNTNLRTSSEYKKKESFDFNVNYH